MKKGDVIIIILFILIPSRLYNHFTIGDQHFIQKFSDQIKNRPALYKKKIRSVIIIIIVVVWYEWI